MNSLNIKWNNGNQEIGLTADGGFKYYPRGELDENKDFYWTRR